MMSFTSGQAATMSADCISYKEFPNFQPAMRISRIFFSPGGGGGGGGRRKGGVEWGGGGEATGPNFSACICRVCNPLSAQRGNLKHCL